MIQDYEYNNNPSEYFPIKKESKKSNKKDKTKNNLVKTLVLSTTLIVSIVTVAIISNTNIITIIPELLKQNIIDYQEYSYDTNFPGSYTIEYIFDTKELQIESIELYAIETPLFNYTDENEEPKKIEKKFRKEDFKQIENNIYINYTFENTEIYYETYFIIKYIDIDTNKIVEETTSKYKTGIDMFIPLDISINSNIYTNILEDKIECTTIIKDYIDSAFDLYIDKIEIYQDDELINPKLNIDLPLKIDNEDQIELKFEIPKPTNDSINIEISIEGSTYYKDKLVHNSSNNIRKEIILGKAYKLNKATINKDGLLTLNGLTIDKVEYNMDYIYGEEIEQVLPNREIYVSILLKGTSTKEFLPNIDVYINEEKITSYELYYLNYTIYEGDNNIYLDFVFTMPNEDILSTDIIINGFITN